MPNVQKLTKMLMELNEITADMHELSRSLRKPKIGQLRSNGTATIKSRPKSSRDSFELSDTLVLNESARLTENTPKRYERTTLELKNSSGYISCYDLNRKFASIDPSWKVVQIINNKTSIGSYLVIILEREIID